MSSIAVSQKVSDVQRATTLLKETSPKDAIERLIEGPVEACSEYRGTVVACPYHPFVLAVHVAFSQHRPLVLSPDMIWLLIAQGFARHVNINAEELRSKFVTHAGKEKIQVRRDDFHKGSLENPWNEVFSAFSEEIKQRIGEDNHSNIVVSFSTTGQIEKATNEAVLMDSMQNYFEYECLTCCGIPEVSLEGRPDDWSLLRDQTKTLGETYGVEWWTDRLLPTLSAIATNAAGADDPQLWKDIYKVDHRSGGTFINGWIVDFFPYLKELAWVDPETEQFVEWNQMQGQWDKYDRTKVDVRNWTFDADDRHDGITSDCFPGSLSRVPFRWKLLDRSFDMEFIAGFSSFTQDSESLAVRPKIGWAVREAN